MLNRIAAYLFLYCFGTGGAMAQGTEIAFGAAHDGSLPIEIFAERLSIDQEDGFALFSGDVVAEQGEMRLSADEMRVEYATEDDSDVDTGQISQLFASGNVMLVNGADAAEAREAVYTIDSSDLVMTGDVILTRGQSTLAANRMTVNLDSGIATMEGRVRTILNSEDK